MPLLSTQDRKFLARIAAVNTVLGGIAIPIIDDTITAEQQARLGRELIEIGYELLRRAGPETASELVTTDADPGHQ